MHQSQLRTRCVFLILSQNDSSPGSSLHKALTFRDCVQLKYITLHLYYNSLSFSLFLYADAENMSGCIEDKPGAPEAAYLS